MTWRPINTAPRNGTPVLVRTKGGHELKAEYNRGAYEDERGSCGGWAATTDNYPACWSEGVCWASNADEVPSDQPVSWRPLGRRASSGEPTRAVRAAGECWQGQRVMNPNLPNSLPEQGD